MGGINVDLFLSSCYLEVNCHGEYENGVCDISIFFISLSFVCFYETKKTGYLLCLAGRFKMSLWNFLSKGSQVLMGFLSFSYF